MSYTNKTITNTEKVNKEVEFKRMFLRFLEDLEGRQITGTATLSTLGGTGRTFQQDVKFVRFASKQHSIGTIEDMLIFVVNGDHFVGISPVKITGEQGKRMKKYLVVEYDRTARVFTREDYTIENRSDNMHQFNYQYKRRRLNPEETVVEYLANDVRNFEVEQLVYENDYFREVVLPHMERHHHRNGINK